MYIAGYPEVRGRTLSEALLTHGQHCHLMPGIAARKPGATGYRDWRAEIVKADSAAEERLDPSGDTGIEETDVLEEALPALAEEGTEALEIYHLAIDLGLSKIRIDGQIQHSCWRNCPFEFAVSAGIPGPSLNVAGSQLQDWESWFRAGDKAHWQICDSADGRRVCSGRNISPGS